MAETLTTPNDEDTESGGPFTYAQAAKQPLGHILRGMHLTGHHKWGFLVYRTTYSPSSQARFDAYITALRSHITFALEVHGYNTDSVLRRSFDLTVVEDPATLDGANKPTVQRIFREWVTSRSVERDGPGVDFGDAEGKDLKALVPRYRMCLFVDEECLRSIEVVHPRTGRNMKTSHRAVVIDVDEQREERCWMWLCLVTTVGLYQEACWRGWDLLWRDPARGEVFNS
ncbi:hypothetical protein V8F06_008539 [Rhypophila decipiens]